MVIKDGSQEPNSVASAQARILVIDHDPATRRVLAKALASVSPLPWKSSKPNAWKRDCRGKQLFGAAIVSFDRRAFGQHGNGRKLRETGILDQLSRPHRPVR
jgi:hypothetical protein